MKKKRAPRTAGLNAGSGARFGATTQCGQGSDKILGDLRKWSNVPVRKLTKPKVKPAAPTTTKRNAAQLKRMINVPPVVDLSARADGKRPKWNSTFGIKNTYESTRASNRNTL